MASHVRSLTAVEAQRAGFLHRLLSGPWLFILPGVLFYGAFALYPVVYQFWVAATAMTTTNISGAEFIGMQNFAVIAGDPIFRGSFVFTVVFVVLTVPVQFVLGFGLALFLDQKLPGRLFFRLSVIVPMAMASIIVGLMWRLLLHESDVGFVNALLGVFGIAPVAWFSEAFNARLSLFLVNVWQAVGTTMIFMLGGLQTLDAEVLEAAEVDGANLWQRVLWIKLPMLRTIAGLAIVLIFAGTFQIFEKVLALTNGGPARATSTIGFEMYTTAFPISGAGQLGLGAAMGLVMFAFILIVTVFYVWLMIFDQERD